MKRTVTSGQIKTLSMSLQPWSKTSACCIQRSSTDGMQNTRLKKKGRERSDHHTWTWCTIIFWIDSQYEIHETTFSFLSCQRDTTHIPPDCFSACFQLNIWIGRRNIASFSGEVRKWNYFFHCRRSHTAFHASAPPKSLKIRRRHRYE